MIRRRKHTEKKRGNIKTVEGDLSKQGDQLSRGSRDNTKKKGKESYVLGGGQSNKKIMVQEEEEYYKGKEI